MYQCTYLINVGKILFSSTQMLFLSAAIGHPIGKRPRNGNWTKVILPPSQALYQLSDGNIDTKWLEFIWFNLRISKTTPQTSRQSWCNYLLYFVLLLRMWPMWREWQMWQKLWMWRNFRCISIDQCDASDERDDCDKFLQLRDSMMSENPK